jgi:carboxymethylenebutenolidase
LVLHPWWGLNATMRALCTRLAEAGFVAFAPDLYHGKLATTIPDADTLEQGLDYAGAKMDVRAAKEFLLAQTGGGDMAVIGFSLGAYFGLELAANAPAGIRRVVIFYGAGEGDFGESQAEFLGHFAEVDEYESQEFTDALEAQLRAAGRPFTLHRYPGTGHWFFEADRTDAFDAAAAELAWARTLAFLRG